MACTYVVKNSAGEEISFNTQEEALKYLKENDVASNSVKGEPIHNTATLANVLRQVSFGENNYNPLQLRVFQEEMLDQFIKMEEESQYFYKMGSPIALTKGLGKSFDQMQGVMKNLSDLGIDVPVDTPLKAPFDVRYLLTGDEQYKPQGQDPYYHKITANNVNIMRKVYALSKTMFMEQAPSFINVSDKVLLNLKGGIVDDIDKVREVKDDLASFMQIAAYKQWIEVNDKKTSTLRNSLIYDSNTNTPTIVDIIKEANAIAPDNTFLKFILPVSTTVKIGKRKARNINNKDVLNTIEGKTRGKIEPDLISNMMDSFAELYLNPRTQYHAKALFDYLIVKDGLMYKNKSFIKMIPTFMFKEISNATDLATELLSLSERQEYSRFIRKVAALEIIDSEGNYKSYFSDADKQQLNDLFREGNLMGIKNKLYEKIFGYNVNQLYNRFEQIYSTDARYQFNLELIKTKVKGATGAQRKASGIAFAEDNGVRYLHVGMFTEDFKAAEEGSEARSRIFKETMADLAAAGFNSVKVGENKTNLEFKKFVRIRRSAGTGPTGEQKNVYVTYKLINVERQGDDGRTKAYTGAAMTAEGDMVPRGTYAVYAPVDVVGTSNSTGVADLGTRPTKDQVIATLNEKIRREGGQNPPPAAPPANPVTPPSGGTPTSGGTYSGQITSLNENQVFVFGSNPLGINGNPDKGTGGAALAALRNGWVQQGEIMDNKLSSSGKAWGLTTVTKPGAKRSMTLDQIKQGIEKLYKLAYANPHKEFLVAYMGKTGTNLNGYSNQELADTFSEFVIPPNIVFEKDFNTLITRKTPSSVSSQVKTETIQGGIFGGMQQMPFDPNDISGFDPGFFTDSSQIDDTLDNLNNC
jgi:hypothetical protein